MAEKKKTSKITSWKPSTGDKIVDQDGKLFVCNFEKVFGSKYKEYFDPYRVFIIGKDSYINQLGIITNYTNFFIKFYDLDNELVAAYLKIKSAVDKNKIFDESKMEAYISFLYEVIFTPTMVDKICKMVDENYLDDIEVTEDEGGRKKYIKSEKKHLESLEFTNQHVKLLLQISFGMKIMSPALFHYIQRSHIKLDKNSLVIYNFYKKLFEIFRYGDTYDMYDANEDLLEEDIDKDVVESFIGNPENNIEVEGRGKDTRYYFTGEDGKTYYYTRTVINIYNKLYVYVRTKVLESNASNSIIFNQRQIFGVDVYGVIDMFIKKVLISENLVKHI